MTAANLDDAATADLDDPDVAGNQATLDATQDRNILVALRAAMNSQLAGIGMGELAVFDTVATAAMFTTNDGPQDISEGVTVEVAPDYTGSGDEGRVYRYIGANASDVNLGTQNYTDTASGCGSTSSS